MTVTLLIRVKGGPGSGNWRHSGRPGLVGGSGGGGSVASVRLSMFDVEPEFIDAGTKLSKIRKEVWNWGSDRGDIGTAAVAGMETGANGILFRGSDNELIGVLSYDISKNVLHIDNFATKRPGIGRASMLHVAQLASGSGVSKISLRAASDAADFYRKIGMIENPKVPLDFEWSAESMEDALAEAYLDIKEVDDEPENGVFAVVGEVFR